MLVVDNAGNVSDIDEEDDEKDAIHEVIIFDEKRRLPQTEKISATFIKR